MELIKRIWLAVGLILIATAILLVSDPKRNSSKLTDTKELPSIAIMTFVSTPVLDNHVKGIIDELKREKLVAEDQSNLHIFNPQGDYATANTAAREMVHGSYDILVTSSTMTLQIVAKANATTRKNHIFGAVTDPYGTGIGITGTKPEDHPPYLAGIGTFQPVEEAFAYARKLNPDLKKVGVVWTPSEQCSAACTKKARKICTELKIDLIEANVNSSAEVKEAVNSLLSKGVEAFWVGGDTVVNVAVPMMVTLAQKQGVPIFTNSPKDVKVGVIFAVGANYYTVGEYTGKMVAEVLRGRLPSTIGIKNIVPNKVAVNYDAVKKYKNWKIDNATVK